MNISDLPTVDDRQRESKKGEYSIQSVKGWGQIICCVPDVRLIDFYRTSTVLAKDVPVKDQKNSIA